MASIEFSPDFTRHSRPSLIDYTTIRTPYFMLGALVASALVIAMALVFQGETIAAWRLASENIQRFSFFIFMIAFVIGPLSRLFPALGLQQVAQERYKFSLAFITAYAVSLLCLLAPYYLPFAAPLARYMPTTTMAFVMGGASALLIMLASAHENAARLFGKMIYRFLDRLALVYFWSIFGLAAFDHLVGPSRPDAFFGFSLSLLIAGLLLRFADAFLEQHKSAIAPTIWNWRRLSLR